jgi:hypothetical protein
MEAHADDSGKAVRVFDEQLRPEPALKLVLESIVETGATLATGHLGAAEIMALVPIALEIGVSRILLTHPHYPSVELSNDQLAQLNRDSRVFIDAWLSTRSRACRWIALPTPSSPRALGRSSSPPTSAKSIAIPCRMVSYALLEIFPPFWMIGSLAKTYWRCLVKTERERSA